MPAVPRNTTTGTAGETAASMTGPDRPASAYSREELESAILGEPPRLTSEEVAAGIGVTLDDARRLWRALGFPDAGEEAAFTEADRVALWTLVGAVEKGAIDFDT